MVEERVYCRDTVIGYYRKSEVGYLCLGTGPVGRRQKVI